MSFKVGQKVKVPVRFGEAGEIVDIVHSRFGVRFTNLPFTLFYSETELRALEPKEKAWSWYRLPCGTPPPTPCAAFPSTFFRHFLFLVVVWCKRHLLPITNRRLLLLLEQIAMTQTETAEQLNALVAQIAKTGEETKKALAALADAIANQGNTSPEVESALAALKVAVQANDDLIPDAATEPTP